MGGGLGIDLDIFELEFREVVPMAKVRSVEGH